MIRIAAKAILTSLVAGLCLAAASLEPPDPFNGDWKVCAARSKFRNAPFQGTLTIRDGRPLWSKPLMPDQQKRPVPIAEATTKLDDRHLESLTWRGKHVIARTLFTLSADGRTITATIVGVSPTGELEDNTIVLERTDSPAPPNL